MKFKLPAGVIRFLSRPTDRPTRRPPARTHKGSASALTTDMTLQERLVCRFMGGAHASPSYHRKSKLPSQVQAIITSSRSQAEVQATNRECLNSYPARPTVRPAARPPARKDFYKTEGQRKRPHYRHGPIGALGV